MSTAPTKRICLFVALNEKGDHFISEESGQEALNGLVRNAGGEAFRVVDLDLDFAVASVSELTYRRAKALNLTVIKSDR